MADNDDTYTSHGFASYNKQPLESAPTLVGNWVEERSLQDRTGVARYETWVKPGEHAFLGATAFAERQDANRPEMLTHPRVIEHSDQQHPGNWSTMTKVSYLNPATRTDLATYANLDKLGPRAKRDMELLMQEAADLPLEVQYTLTGKPALQTLDSTYQAHFDEKDMTGLMIGTRVIKDPDGRPAQRDPTFLAETQICVKGNVDRIMKPEGTMAGATQSMRLSNHDVPVTIYSEGVATGTYGDAFNGTRTMSKAQPFAKYANFSKPMSEYNKVVVDQ